MQALLKVWGFFILPLNSSEHFIRFCILWILRGYLDTSITNPGISNSNG